MKIASPSANGYKQECKQGFHVHKAKPFSQTAARFANALEALWTNRTPSVLAVLVNLIGVAAVVAAYILMQGAGTYFANQILGEGTNVITINPGIIPTRGLSRSTTVRSLSFQDFQEVIKLPHITMSSPILYAEGGQAVYEKQNRQTNGRGVSADYQHIASWNMAQGLWFSNADNAGARPVVVIGDTVYQHLFAPLNIDPIGKTITYQGQPFKIIGVLASRGGFDLDDILYFPYNTLRYRLSKDLTNVDEIIVQTDTVDSVDQVVRAIQFSLERSHHIAKGTPDDFTITTADQLLQQARQEAGALTALFIGVVAISLIVGGIGVMNIMQVSVAARAREIAIRLSIGARRSTIRNQFLIEALVLCLMGAGFGLLPGLLIGWGLTAFFGMPFVVTWITLCMPLVVSSLIGLVFGLVPAIRASRLDPVRVNAA
jgi:putative ABC transport system permease protein